MILYYGFCTLLSLYRTCVYIVCFRFTTAAAEERGCYFYCRAATLNRRSVAMNLYFIPLSSRRPMRRMWYIVCSRTGPRA